MKEYNFYIDRQFGYAIFIKVENGIVKDIINESEKYINRMKELYLDKEISFLKKDFEAKMEGVFHCVHSTDLSDAKQILRGCESREEDFKRILRKNYSTAIPNDKFSIDDCRKLKELQTERYNAKINLEATKKMIKEIHKFDFEKK